MAFEHTRFLVTALFAYGVLSLTHIAVQLTLAVIHNLRFASFARGHPLPPPTAEWPSASVIVPSYNESTDELRLCLESILAQDYPRLQAICVDDGSTQLVDELLELYTSLGERSVEVLMLPENVAKRRAQVAALQVATGEIIVTVDSDTSLADPAAIRKLVRGFTDEGVAAAGIERRPGDPLFGRRQRRQRRGAGDLGAGDGGHGRAAHDRQRAEHAGDGSVDSDTDRHRHERLLGACQRARGRPSARDNDGGRRRAAMDGCV